MNIALYTLRAVSEAIITPPYAVMLLVLAVVLYTRNKKTVVLQKMIIGESLDTAFELTISQVVIGILAGTFTSLLLSYLGIIFNNEIMLVLLFLVSIILMFSGGRFICFSYSAGILGIISVVLQLLKVYFKVDISSLSFLKVDVLSLVSLVAILHIVEGILVVLDGGKGAIPVFTNRDDKIIGGFAFKRYWMLPIVLLFVIQNPDLSYVAGAASTPNWWPIIKSNYLNLAKSAVIGLSAFYGMLGYSTVTFTKTKQQKVTTSGISIISYGIGLLLIAQLANINLFFQLFVAIVMPFLHELMLKVQSYFEVKGTPKYISSDDGLMVLEVAPDSPAFEMGIKTGDVLVELNDKKIINEEDIVEVLNDVSSFLWIKIRNVKGKINELNYNKMNKSKRLGIVFVPRGIPKDRVVVKMKDNSFQDILNKQKDKDNRDK